MLVIFIFIVFMDLVWWSSNNNINAKCMIKVSAEKRRQKLWMFANGWLLVMYSQFIHTDWFEKAIFKLQRRTSKCVRTVSLCASTACDGVSLRTNMWIGDITYPLCLESWIQTCLPYLPATVHIQLRSKSGLIVDFLTSYLLINIIIKFWFYAITAVLWCDIWKKNYVVGELRNVASSAELIAWLLPTEDANVNKKKIRTVTRW